MLSTALLVLTLSQVDMTPMLERGPMVLIEDSKGKFSQATAVMLIDAPPDLVWGVISKMEDFKTFVPKVLTSDVERKEGKLEYEVHFVIDVPGIDTDYTVKYWPDPVARTIRGLWVKGDLKGSIWEWKVEKAPGNRTLLSHTSSVKNFSAIAQSIEDEQQTVTVGINVASGLAAVKAVKSHCEALAHPPAGGTAAAKP